MIFLSVAFQALRKRSRRTSICHSSVR